MSKLINKTRFTRFANDLWDKIKGRYDKAFKEATISASDSADKKITFTRISGTNPVDVNLQDYARLQDKNEFKQDVSADNVGIANNSHIGSTKGFTSINRGLGFRQLTTNAFVDGYVDHIRIYLEGSATGNATFKVWAITKNAADRTQDRVKKVIHQSTSLAVQSITEGATERKFVIIPVKESFADETYFIARCNTHNVEVAQTIKAEYTNDVVNLNNVQPPDAENSVIDWNVNADSNTAIMYLYGRESIGSLALKLKQTQADGSLYVKQAEVSVTSEANKVVRLGADGKLDANMLPAIAINEYFPATEFTHAALSQLTFQNGDVVVVTKGNKAKRYLCVDKAGHASNLTEAFVELNDKSGVVTSVNDVTGVVNLKIEATTEKLQLKVNDTMKSEVDIISDAEIEAIINGLN